MLVIRLFRVGKKNQPSFKIVVTDKRRPPRGGRFLEQVGFYNPLTKEKVLKDDRLRYWLSVGAKPSVTVYNFLVSAKIIQGKKILKHKESKKKEPSVAKAMEGEEEKKDIPSDLSAEASAKAEATEKESSKQDSVVTKEKKEGGA
jgi:small subunit ribosomal protein S16